jgi:hypothetical protein
LFDVVETPPTTDAGDRMTESSATGLTVRMAVLRTPLYVAEIVTGVVAETADVVIVKTGDAVAPAATATEAGTPTPIDRPAFPERRLKASRRRDS